MKENYCIIIFPAETLSVDVGVDLNSMLEEETTTTKKEEHLEDSPEF